MVHISMNRQGKKSLISDLFRFSHSLGCWISWVWRNFCSLNVMSNLDLGIQNLPCDVVRLFKQGLMLWLIDVSPESIFCDKCWKLYSFKFVTFKWLSVQTHAYSTKYQYKITLGSMLNSILCCIALSDFIAFFQVLKQTFSVKEADANS